MSSSSTSRRTDLDSGRAAEAIAVLEAARAVGDHLLIASALCVRGMVESAVGDADAAARSYAEAFTLA